MQLSGRRSQRHGVGEDFGPNPGFEPVRGGDLREHPEKILAVQCEAGKVEVAESRLDIDEQIEIAVGCCVIGPR
jgi:hypothetical protein